MCIIVIVSTITVVVDVLAIIGVIIMCNVMAVMVVIGHVLRVIVTVCSHTGPDPDQHATSMKAMIPTVTCSFEVALDSRSILR